MTTKSKAVIGTRGSKLATTQSEWVAARLRDANPGLDVSLRIFSTRGDREVATPILELGGKGAFTEELQAALQTGEIDFAVHSLKDLPTVQVPGVAVVAYPERVDPRDAWVSPKGHAFADLANGGVVGTSSLRRQAMVLAMFPKAEVEPIRGNVDTRLRKAGEGVLHGTLLAAAGLKRLGLEEHITECLDPEIMLPSPGQGILAVEGGDKEELWALAAPLDHLPTRLAALAERAFLRVLEGGCLVPAGALAVLSDKGISLTGVVASPDGAQVIRRSGTAAAEPEAAAELGERIAHEVLGAGGREVLDALQEGAEG